MKLTLAKEIKKMELIEGSYLDGILPYDLVHPSTRDDIQFAIDQLKKYPCRWQLRKRYDGLMCLFVDYPKNYDGSQEEIE